MGNKLDSIRYALGQGLTGVAKPTKTLEAVDNFVEDVEAWKKNIDDQRLKLKTDTATKVREAEKEAYANLPNTKTERDLVIQGLANYKDMLYNNMSMVQNGVLKPEDNLIFQENGKQSFEIAADLINNYSTRKEQAMKEASGYYDEEGNFVEPTAGDYQAALQRINDEFMIPGGQEFKFMSNGMGNITMFKTKIDEETKTKVLDLDADGNPIPIEGLSNVPMLAYQNNRNAKAPMLVLANEVTKFTRKDGLLATSYQELIDVKGMVGSVKDNMSQSPGFQESVKQASSSLTNTVPKVVSMLADNGPDAQQTTTLTPSEWDALSDAQKNETISFEYTDFDGSTKKGVKSKYLQVKLASNNSMVAVLNDRDQLAAEQIAQTALISSLEQTIDPGSKVGDFAPQRISSGERKDVSQGVRVVSLLNDIRGAKDPLAVKNAITELQGISGGVYEDLQEITEKVTINGKEQEIVTGITFNIDGTTFPINFGEVVTDSSGNKTFKESNAEDYINTAYSYVTRGKGLGSDLAIKEYKKAGKSFFTNTSQLESGSRNFKFGSKGVVSLEEPYSLGGNKTTLKDELGEVFRTADEDDSGMGINREMLKIGVDSKIRGAFEAVDKSLPEGFKVILNGDNLSITTSLKDENGVSLEMPPLKITYKDDDEQKLISAIQDFLNSLPQ
jgi:hypothetical protein